MVPTVGCIASSVVRVRGPSRRRGRRSQVSALPRSAFGSRDANFFECDIRKRSFSRRDVFTPNSQRKTLTVDLYHPLCSLAALGFIDCLFRWRNTALQKCLAPLQQSFSIRGGRQCPQGAEPYFLLFPLLRAPRAGRRWGILVGQNRQAVLV